MREPNRYIVHLAIGAALFIALGCVLVILENKPYVDCMEALSRAYCGDRGLEEFDPWHGMVLCGPAPFQPQTVYYLSVEEASGCR